MIEEGWERMSESVCEKEKEKERERDSIVRIEECERES